MKAVIDSSREPAALNLNSVIYIRSPFDTVADDFARENNIYAARFKSKTWSKICRLCNKMHGMALKKLFPEASSIRFSWRAGCGMCNCSPGFVMKFNPNKQIGNFIVNIEASEDEVTQFRAKLNNGKLTTEFAKELAAHQAASQ